MGNKNLSIDKFLKIYSQSLISTNLTRGLDDDTYIETKLDKSLRVDILSGKKKLIVLTGNAGDGKTAFIQLIESYAESEGAIFVSKTDSGSKFIFNNFEFETLYDGSQDFKGKSNDEMLQEFFKPFEGNNEPLGNFVKIIAINEGKLRDYILKKKEYAWLGKHVHHYLEFDNYKLPDVLTFVNLNNRAIIEPENPKSIFDNLLDILLDINEEKGIWSNCSQDNCEYSDRCYIKYNIDSFRDKEKGSVIRERLKELILLVYLKKEKHITMRDIRSVISFVFFNKYTCNQIQDSINKDENLLDRFYYNNAFNNLELDRIVHLLSHIDVADVPIPKLENHLYFTSPKSQDSSVFYNNGFLQSNPDLNYLEEYYKNRPIGTSDSDKSRSKSAEIYLQSIKRKIFFEGKDDLLKENFQVIHTNILPYRNFEIYTSFLKTGIDTGNTLRDDITLAISKSEKIYNEVVGKENICIRSNNIKRSITKAFYGFKSADFEVTLPEIGIQKSYVEFFPDHIIFRHVDKSASLEINIDLFEILMRIKEGYVPTSIEIQTFFLNLEMFKRRILSKRSNRVFLTEDDSNLYSIEKSVSGKLVMNKV